MNKRRKTKANNTVNCNILKDMREYLSCLQQFAHFDLNGESILKKLTAIFLILFVVLFGLQSLTVLAVEDNGSKVVDKFDTLVHSCGSGASNYWCVVSGTSIYEYGRHDGVGCDVFGVNCVSLVNVGNDSVVNLHIEQHPYGGFSFAQIGEKLEAQSYGTPMRWHPANGYKVVVKATVRTLGGYAENTANGSTGWGLWNEPYYLTGNPEFPLGANPIKALWVSWTDPNSFLAGLNGAYYNQSTLGALTPDGSVNILSGISISDWFTTKMVWKADGSGNQTIKFVISQGAVSNTYTLSLATPITDDLSFVFWQDCLRAISPYAAPTCVGPNPGQPQDVQMTKLVIKNVQMNADEDED